jgi:hypothetical protein
MAEIVMSTRARAFVHCWIDENVGPELHREERHRSREYAARCLMAARERGISTAEILDEFGNLATHIALIGDRAGRGQPGYGFSWRA